MTVDVDDWRQPARSGPKNCANCLTHATRWWRRVLARYAARGHQATLLETTQQSDSGSPW